LHEEADSGPATEVVVISGLSLSSVTVDADVSSLTESLPVLATRVPRAADCPPGELLTAMVLRAASMAQADGLLLEPVAEAEPDSVAIGTPAGSGFEWRVVTGVRTRPLGVLLEETLRVAGEPAADPDVEDLSIPPSAIAVVNFGDLGVDGFAGLLDDSGVPVLSVGRVVDRPRLRDGRVQACRTVRLTLSAPAAEMRPLDGVRFLARVREILEHPVLLAGW
jgi:pyruvate/2-oxoglutarate dehydrogenase complex dihydrolipoamide acyltransferase (E2) component